MITVKQFAFDVLCGLALVSRSLAEDNTARAAHTFRAGDKAVVAVAEAPLMRGYATLANAAEGQPEGTTAISNVFSCGGNPARTRCWR